MDAQEAQAGTGDDPHSWHPTGCVIHTLIPSRAPAHTWRLPGGNLRGLPCYRLARIWLLCRSKGGPQGSPGPDWRLTLACMDAYTLPCLMPELELKGQLQHHSPRQLPCQKRRFISEMHEVPLWARLPRTPEYSTPFLLSRQAFCDGLGCAGAQVF